MSKFLWARFLYLAGSSKSRFPKGSNKEQYGIGKSSESRPRAGGSLDGLNELVEKGSITKQEAQVRFLELLEKHRLIGERLLGC